MEVMGLLWEVGGVLALGGVSILGLLLQGLRICNLEEALEESRASVERLRVAELELQLECRELRSALRAERGRSERLETQLKLLRQWAAE
ncbi:hypothetical protein [Azotobacter salinestris]|uniref:hypothetical protein n=1 Tax=Azotobacter salinestris TaxID=69964 RepID=UPI0032DE979C